MKILIVKPSSLGDVVQALPVLRLLKSHHPSSEIYWWLSNDLLPLLQGDPDLTDLIPFDRRRWAWPRYWPELARSVRQMRALAFDWVIDLQGLARSGLFSWLAHGHLTVGLDDPREGARGFYDIIVPRPTFYTHAVDWYLEVLRTLKLPVHGNFTWLPFRHEAARAIQEKWQASDRRWIIVNPGARWFNKRWPVEHFRGLVRQIATTHPDLHLAILGGKDDRAIGAAIAQEDPKRCLDLTGKTSLPEMIEWIRLSELIVTNDTGPMHVAAALAKPVVAVFGPTEPRRTGPYQQIEHSIRVPLPCSPCLSSTCRNENPLECVWAITPSVVFAQVEARLNDERPALAALSR